MLIAQSRQNASAALLRTPDDIQSSELFDGEPGGAGKRARRAMAALSRQGEWAGSRAIDQSLTAASLRQQRAEVYCLMTTSALRLNFVEREPFRLLYAARLFEENNDY